MRSRNARVPNDNYLLLLLGRLGCEGIMAVHWTQYRFLCCFRAAFGRSSSMRRYYYYYYYYIIRGDV